VCELLILNRSNTHADPEKDRSGCYKLGDIVVVADDGVVWGNGECLPDFVRARLPGVPASVVQALVAHQTKTASELAPASVRAIPRLMREYGKRPPENYRRRRYCAPVNMMQPDAEGYISITIDQLKDKNHAG